VRSALSTCGGCCWTFWGMSMSMLVGSS
jgi:hypothetical protein